MLLGQRFSAYSQTCAIITRTFLSPQKETPYPLAISPPSAPLRAPGQSRVGSLPLETCVFCTGCHTGLREAFTPGSSPELAVHLPGGPGHPSLPFRARITLEAPVDN